MTTKEDEAKMIQMSHIIFVNLNWMKKMLENMNYPVSFYHMSLLVTLPNQQQIQIMRVYDTRTKDSYLWYVSFNCVITKICVSNIELLNYIKQNAPHPLITFKNRLKSLGIKYYKNKVSSNTIFVELTKKSVAEIKFTHLGFCLMHNNEIHSVLDMEQLIDYVIEVKTLYVPVLSPPFEDEKYFSIV